MNGRVAKRLRKTAVEISETLSGAKEIENIDGTWRYPKTCTKGIYKILKKKYKLGILV